MGGVGDGVPDKMITSLFPIQIDCEIGDEIRTTFLVPMVRMAGLITFNELLEISGKIW